jgi:hypothetical protein
MGNQGLGNNKASDRDRASKLKKRNTLDYPRSRLALAHHHRPPDFFFKKKKKKTQSHTQKKKKNTQRPKKKRRATEAKGKIHIRRSRCTKRKKYTSAEADDARAPDKAHGARHKAHQTRRSVTGGTHNAQCTQQTWHRDISDAHIQCTMQRKHGTETYRMHIYNARCNANTAQTTYRMHIYNTRCNANTAQRHIGCTYIQCTMQAHIQCTMQRKHASPQSVRTQHLGPRLAPAHEHGAPRDVPRHERRREPRVEGPRQARKDRDPRGDRDKVFRGHGLVPHGAPVPRRHGRGVGWYL